ncbi:hypothetical protein [Intestinimonas butyriciproducens]|uniref:hypothetical protein n=1 Tax=Intestinimonas butyriciproducens TaxID=1297617 RepID=UPI001AB0481F|nr:hypothetical protein [Intestinimonas butyriciproducens]MBO3280968.1 hypothetical protein [Intestinimonas butyriciproducens]
MAFTKLKLTTFGQTIEAKRHQGKGIRFTRVAIGDGLLGNGSMINRTALVSERHTMKIDGVLTTDGGKQSVVVVTLDNSQFDEGFSYRELGLLAQDPDTQEEGVYLYDNAGAECEYLDTKDNGVVIYERLKLQIRVEQADTISFEASGNPLNITWTDIEPLLAKKADLGGDGKVPEDQLPEMNYEPLLKDNAAKDTPVDGDSLPIVDSADGGKTKRLLWSRAKAALKGYFDSLYAAAAHSHAWSAITGKPPSFTPSAHASTHGSGGSDPVTPAAIGAAAATHQHGAGDINSGTLDAARLPTMAVNKGGTGKTSWSANRLIYPSASTTLAQLAFPSVAGSVLRQGTSGAPYWTSLQDLVAALGDAGGVRIATGSYTGTGTYGANNPCSLTFPFVPKLIMLLGNVGADGSYSPSLGASSGGYCVHLINVDKLTTTYQAGLGLANYSRFDAYGKKSSDGKTFSWYYNYTGSRPNDGINYQCNISGTVYYYAIIG